MEKKLNLEKKLDLKVRIISKEIVKPSSPTPTHLKKFKLSLLDQMFPDFHIPTLIFYHPTSSTALDKIVQRLKSSLSRTLTDFYPLAGRFQDESIINCNDEGVPFIETRVNCNLSTLISSSSIRKWLSELVPSQQLLLPPQTQTQAQAQAQYNKNMAQLAFQINVFACGGVVVGWYGSHKLVDAISIVTFFKHWATINNEGRNLQLDLVQPNFDAAVNAFPPCPDGIPQAQMAYNRKPAPTHINPSLDHFIRSSRKITQQYHTTVNIVGRTFVFSNVALDNLKARAISNEVPNPTRFKAVAGFIWTHCIAATDAALGPVVEPRSARLSFPINLRGRTHKVLPKGSIGNLTAQLVIHAEKTGGFSDRVRDIHLGVGKATDEVLMEYQKGTHAILAYREMLARQVFTPKYDPNLYMLTSWCKVGLDELDFGFGKPQWVTPTDEAMMSAQKNFIKLSDYIHPNGDASSNGIAAWVYLEEKAMKILESNPDFLDVADLQW